MSLPILFLFSLQLFSNSHFFNAPFPLCQFTLSFCTISHFPPFNPHISLSTSNNPITHFLIAPPNSMLQNPVARPPSQMHHRRLCDRRASRTPLTLLQQRQRQPQSQIHQQTEQARRKHHHGLPGKLNHRLLTQRCSITFKIGD